MSATDERRPGTVRVVAIDGPGGSGKSTVSREVARRLGWRYLDTGAMYRAVTLAVLEQRVRLDDPDAIGALAAALDVEVGTDPDDPWTRIDGRIVTAEIRTREVTNAVSAVSAVPAVRSRLVDVQRRVIADGDVVVEGRDIGTTVVPDAGTKIFLTASAAVRAERRSRDAAAPDAGDASTAQREIEQRDHRDSTREASPLTCAEDACEIDATHLTAEEVASLIVNRHQAGSTARQSVTR
ncbi:MAG TPA: (d)CMP kinase [Mycobacteriales bacterium]|nr:(d)CMP kinase [Mycobacteriales bacterium]